MLMLHIMDGLFCQWPMLIQKGHKKGKIIIDWITWKEMHHI